MSSPPDRQTEPVAFLARADSVSGSSAAPLELFSPRCGYNLRGLPQPRCPECGLDFDWAALAAAERLRRENPLFEYQWRYRPVHAFVTTVARTLWPPWLWRGVRLEVAPAIGPLLVFGLLVALLAESMGLVEDYVVTWYLNRLTPVLEIGRFSADLALQVAIGVAVWLSLQLFWQTRRRGRVRQVHFVRVVVLAWVALVVWRRGLLLVLGASVVIFRCVNGRLWYVSTGTTLYLTWLSRLAECMALGTFIWSLGIGLCRYLRMRGGLGVLVLALAVSLVMLFMGLVAVGLYGYDSYDNPWVRCVERAWPNTAGLVQDLAKWVLNR